MMRPPAAGTTRTLHALQNGIHTGNTHTTTEQPPKTRRRREPQPSPPSCTTNGPPIFTRDSFRKLAIAPLHALSAHSGSQHIVQVKKRNLSHSRRIKTKYRDDNSNGARVSHRRIQWRCWRPDKWRVPSEIRVEDMARKIAELCP
ncbi:hypothetical protein TCDM_12288 [Trypanosoma cruzi Dm28c]|uniref:Uncharacterized protein n=1 Tax=Trypanosoma cruzi Dm28c TaxID=1416333 RepID=V5B486_TRYCR|nr:hypothetical protein TCDM_12288 [Trypanosoma cruzi Dm28c]